MANGQAAILTMQVKAMAAGQTAFMVGPSNQSRESWQYEVILPSGFLCGWSRGVSPLG